LDPASKSSAKPAGAGSTGALVEDLVGLVGTLRPQSADALRHLFGLTPRARELLAQVFAGNGNREIARKAGLSCDRAIDRDALSHVRYLYVLESKIVFWRALELLRAQVLAV